MQPRRTAVYMRRALVDRQNWFPNRLPATHVDPCEGWWGRGGEVATLGERAPPWHQRARCLQIKPPGYPSKGAATQSLKTKLATRRPKTRAAAQPGLSLTLEVYVDIIGIRILIIMIGCIILSDMMIWVGVFSGEPVCMTNPVLLLWLYIFNSKLRRIVVNRFDALVSLQKYTG